MKKRLNDNEVREVARMQQKIDAYEVFIKALNLASFGLKDVTIPAVTDTPFDREMHQIWKWVKEHKDNK